MNAPYPITRRYRTIWISDLHLGTRGCNSKLLLDFLKHTESDFLYLVGDIIDGSGAGCLDWDLGKAVQGALAISP